MGLGSTNVCGAQNPNYRSAVSAAYEAGHIAKAAPGTVVMIKGYNSGPQQFIQLHDAAAVAAEGAVPLALMTAAAQDNFSFLIPVCGLPPTTLGIFVCNSSTGPTKTIGAADCWFEIYYI